MITGMGFMESLLWNCQTMRDSSSECLLTSVSSDCWFNMMLICGYAAFWWTAQHMHIALYVNSATLADGIDYYYLAASIVLTLCLL